MITVTKMMRVDCDRAHCYHLGTREIEFDGFNGVNKNFLKDAKFQEITIGDSEHHLCSDCYSKAKKLLRKFMNGEQK